MAYPGEPTVGAVEYKYNRIYIVVDPTFPSGPPTYRVSNPDELAGPGGGTGGGAYDFDGVLPIVVNTQPGDGTNPTVIETSMDIIALDNRESP
jgi:hypothetical protein